MIKLHLLSLQTTSSILVGESRRSDSFELRLASTVYNKGIEKRTKTWAKTLVDRSAKLGEWMEVCNKIAGCGMPIFAYANNHYAGNGPVTAREFEALWKAQGAPKAKAKRAENLRLF
jgi:uncharacterized protein YecE (DUF72 family)